MDQFPPERGEGLEEMQSWVHPVMNPIPRQASPSHPLKGMASEQLQLAVGGTDLCLCPCHEGYGYSLPAGNGAAVDPTPSPCPPLASAVLQSSYGKPCDAIPRRCFTKLVCRTSRTASLMVRGHRALMVKDRVLDGRGQCTFKGLILDGRGTSLSGKAGLRRLL